MFILLPWVAPLLMKVGFERAGNWLYLLYSLVCHQFPQRSIFLFGDQLSYSIDTFQPMGTSLADPFVMRTFVGNEQMGWKVAWSDRMISLYGGVWIWTVLWLALPKMRRSIIRSWICLLLLIPMIVDGVTHFLNDVYFGMGAGFRYENMWLAKITFNLLPPNFYVGDQLGSFNSWMRWLSGYTFSFGLMWWVLPRLQRPVKNIR